METSKLLSCLEAHRKYRDGSILWEEFIHHLLIRCKGIIHPDDDFRDVYAEVMEADPFAYSIYGWSKRLKEWVDDIKPMEDVFVAYKHATFNDVTVKLAALNSELAKNVRKSLAMLALQDRRADVLKMCMGQGGFPYESYFEDEANAVDEEKDPETYRVLEDSDFRRMYPRPEPSQRRSSDSDSDDEDEDSESDADSGVGYDDAEQRHRHMTRIAPDFDVGGRYPVPW